MPLCALPRPAARHRRARRVPAARLLTLGRKYRIRCTRAFVVLADEGRTAANYPSGPKFEYVARARVRARAYPVAPVPIRAALR